VFWNAREDNRGVVVQACKALARGLEALVVSPRIRSRALRGQVLFQLGKLCRKGREARGRRMAGFAFFAKNRGVLWGADHSRVNRRVNGNFS
jgi:hypothetical protein